MTWTEKERKSMKHLGTQYLKTEKLILRPFTADDVPAMYRNWACDEQVVKFLTWPAHADEGTTREILTSWVENYKDERYYQWAIELKGTDFGPIGSISVTNEIDPQIKMAEIGYCIGRRWWHTGVTSRALKAVMDFLFDQVGVNKVQARHDLRNVHSGHVMKKCGMKYEGTLRQADRNNSGVCDAVYYGLLAEERRQAAKE